MNESQYIFIDEYGDTNLNVDISNVSTYYILTSVIIDAVHHKSENEKAIEIIKRNFQKGELKSSTIAQDIQRRIKVCKELCALDFHFYSIAFDKSEIRKNSGLKYQDSFIKNLNGKLYKVLFRAFSNISIWADEQKDQKFIDSFRKYIETINQEDFFITRKIETVSSKEYPFVQVADFISGSLARYYDIKKFQKESKELIDLLLPKCLGIDEWPIKLHNKIYKPTIGNTDYDSIISDTSVRSAEAFIKENEYAADGDIELQVLVLKYLLFQFLHNDSEKYIPTHEIIRNLESLGFQDISLYKLRLRIIAKLRDSNVIIASSPDGYKIPSSLIDMHNFVERANSVAVPMLGRVRKAQEQFLLVSKNNLNIVDDERFLIIKKLISSL